MATTSLPRSGCCRAAETISAATVMCEDRMSSSQRDSPTLARSMMEWISPILDR
jgi:hypothetical protein